MQNIFGAIKEEQSRILMTCNSAREMWIKLESEYEEAAADSIPLLWTKFYGCTFRQGQSVSSFLTELEQIAFRLKSLHIAIDDEQIMAKVLMSLPAEFRVFGFAWESTPVAEKTLKRLTTRIITLDKSMRNDEEKRSTPAAAFLSKNKNGAEPHDEESRERALPAQFDRGKRGHSSHQQSGATKGCWECKSTTHVRAHCRQYKRQREKEEDEADRKRKRFDQNDRRDSDRSRDQRDKDRHCRDDSRDEKDYQKERKGYSYTSSTDHEVNKPSTWYADSGATQHMTDNRALLTNFVPTGP
ncbi:serine/threonine-protein kinase fray2-like [Daphnia pulex]|uniref:serine/threonine-protein kinase fray2-like n=1 Tax=Daphnia pulex TaxID=6669 RepID=UPI001EDFDEEC|nr:serine/threonine-protein kinase fray2-like [Daphnia pulex]